MAKAQPRKPMKMPLPPLPNGSSGAPALPPRRGPPPPPPPADQDEYYDESSVEDDEQDYDDFDVEGETKTPGKPPFRPPPVPTTETDEYYDEFEGSESAPPSGPSVYVMDGEIDDTPDPPQPPPPPASNRPKLPKPPIHEEVEYMEADEDENISAGSYKSNSSAGSSGPPLPPSHGKPALPSRDKAKKPGPSIFALDSSTLTNMKSKLKNVGFNKKPENKKTDEDNPKLFVNALKPEKNSLPVKPTPPLKPPSQTSNLKNKFLNKFSTKTKDMPPVPPIPTDIKIDTFKNSESRSYHSEHGESEHSNSSHHDDQIDHSTSEIDDDEFPEELYDDATSLLADPLDVHKWYHGAIDRTESNRRLETVKSDGAFLVRKSTKDNSHPYTLAVMFKNSIQNLKVRLRNDKKYALGEYKDNEVIFSSLPEVIEHHKKKDVILIGHNTGTVKLKDTPLKK